MAPTAKVALDVNVPLTGTVKFVDYYPEKPNPNTPGKVYPAQWALTGTWTWQTPEGEDRAAEGKVYIDAYQLGASPLQAGYVEHNGTWPDGNPKYRWTYTGPVRVVKTEKDRKRHVTISRLDGSPTAAGAEPPPPAVSHSTPARVATPASVPPSGDEAWGALERTYARAHAIAVKTWGESYPPEALVAAAATLFIEANKRGLTSKTHRNDAAFQAMPPALQATGERMPWDED